MGKEEIKELLQFYLDDYENKHDSWPNCDVIEMREKFRDLVKSYLGVLNEEQPSLPEDLEEAAEEYRRETCNEACKNSFLDNHPSPSIKTAFKAGAEWMAGQGVSGKIIMTYRDGTALIECPLEGKTEDKVIVQILQQKKRI